MALHCCALVTVLQKDITATPWMVLSSSGCGSVDLELGIVILFEHRA